MVLVWLVQKYSAELEALAGGCRYSRMDAGALVLWAIAVATVVGGALWAGYDHSREALSAGASAGSEVLPHFLIT